MGAPFSPMIRQGSMTQGTSIKEDSLMKSIPRVYASGRAYVVVDISNICLLTEIYPQDGYHRMCPQSALQTGKGSSAIWLRWEPIS